MTNYSDRGFFNHAYHDSETLEIDRRLVLKTHHTNPYPREDPPRQGGGAYTHYPSAGQVSWTGSESESIPMGFISSGPGSPSWQHELNHSPFQIPPESDYDRPIPLPSSASGNANMRWKGVPNRRMSVFPDADPAHLAFTEDAMRAEMEDEERNRVKELLAMSTQDRIRAIRDLPMSFEEKKHIRSQVLALKSAKQSRQFTCFADCSEDASLSLRRCGYTLRSARQSVALWQGIMKEIGGKFGTSVLTYFLFLKWLLMFNVFSFLINFGFITVPLLVYDLSPNVPVGVSFRGLEILTGAGYFNYTVMYYGGYSNETLTAALADYNMQLAYFFTITLYMVLCGAALVFSTANSFKENFVLADPVSNSAWQLLCSWDFNLTNERAVRQRKNNLRVQLKESLSEKAERARLTLAEKMTHFWVHLGSWLLSTNLAVGCGASIYYLCIYEQQQTTDAARWSLLQEAKTLLVPFVVSLVNLVVPLFYSLFNKFELYSSQRRQIYALVLRNVLLRMSILAVLCYHWMNVVAETFSCWESMVGQALYRLVIFDFLFLMLGSFFGEFLSNVIGTRLLPRHGVPEFDVARNVLDLIYAQTLAWIGIYFSPLLPAIQILKFFILFYLKKVSLTQNCQPPRRSGRAAQMQTIFIALLFFPFFAGALSVVAYTAWSLTPSERCGPFRGLNNTFSVVGVWMEGLEDAPGSQWAIWIYRNVIRSEVFYFFITLIIIIIINIFWQVTRGRKHLIGQLRQQIVNEGKDKSFLLDKLQNLQKSTGKPKQKNNTKPSNRHLSSRPSGSQSNSNALVQALIARQRLEDAERLGSGGLPGPDISTSGALVEQTSSSSALLQAMRARQEAQIQEWDGNNSTAGFPENPTDGLARAMQARQRAEEYGEGSLPSSVSGVMMQVRQGTQEPPQNPGSSALIQAMLARQEAQNEYDDGY
ncbi:transmembrane channel-like protein 5 [Brachionichthys hirsutus]|uniref:transmembrane channel-like protein 5 n=1 Tax=Brachionichthys hirsutus TaxID=412623 RepID=UPI00360485A2